MMASTNQLVIEKLMYFLENHKSFSYEEVKMLEEVITMLSKCK